jgi:hypothetical protein
MGKKTTSPPVDLKSRHKELCIVFEIIELLPRVRAQAPKKASTAMVGSAAIEAALKRRDFAVRIGA